ncbi:MAG: universal stress protein [Proteobacteria bacterium]|nr:universal stress protein [Pseudomonadota bacterium]
MLKYHHVLYCTDFSEDADIALIHAVDLAKRYQARLHVLHVMDSPYRYMPSDTREGAGPGEMASATPEVIERVRADVIERYQGRLEGLSDVTWTVTPGVPFVEIVRFARENQVDLIVMGAAGRSEFERVRYGSTVENVSRRAHCHVMAIRNPEKTYTL